MGSITPVNGEFHQQAAKAELSREALKSLVASMVGLPKRASRVCDEGGMSDVGVCECAQSSQNIMEIRAKCPDYSHIEKRACVRHLEGSPLTYQF